jgi:hypothetical protein
MYVFPCEFFHSHVFTDSDLYISVILESRVPRDSFSVDHTRLLLTAESKASPSNRSQLVGRGPKRPVNVALPSDQLWIARNFDMQ